MKPRERCGQVSIANAEPAGHSAPMPMPSNVRNTNRNMKVGENPAMKLQIEYQKIEIISGSLRPIPSARRPEGASAEEPHPQGQREHDRDFGGRDLEFVGNRLDDQQKDRE